MKRLADFLYETVGMAVTLFVISLGLGLLVVFLPAFDRVNEEAQYQAIQIKEGRFAEFDSVRVNRAKIESAMRRYSTEQNFHLYFDTGAIQFVADPTGYYPTCLDIDFTVGKLLTTTRSGCDVTLDQIRAEGGLYYINPSDTYVATLLRDVTDRVAGILFKKI